ncbi:MAG: mechanosensitive ion channel family protein [Halobacteriota archaeon]
MFIESVVLQLGLETIDYGEIVARSIAFLIGLVGVLFVGRVLFVPLVTKGLENRDIDRSVRSLGESVARALVWFAAIAIAFTLGGFGTFLAAFATLGGALALAVGFAAQDLIGNFVAGIFILKDKPFEVGDWIEWKENSGMVEDIDLRVSRIRTFDNELVTVPNGELANNAVTNPVAYQTLRQKFVFGIGYDDDITEATEYIIEEARAHPDILNDPDVSVRLVELGDSDVGLQSRFWIENPRRADFVRIRSEYVQAVKERFDEEGIDIPYAHRTLTGEVEVLESIADDAQENRN